MKISYKWPIVANAQSNAQHSIFTNKQNNEQVSSSSQTLNIGIATIIFYILTFAYIYITAINNQKKSPDLKFKPMFGLNTLSTSFEYSEKVGTTILLMIFLALIQGLFSSQNIYSDDLKRAPIIAFNYVIVLCWLLFMFVFPHKSGDKEKVSLTHFFLAFCVLGSLIINCFLIVNSYSEYYNENDLTPLIGINYSLVAVALIAGLTMICNGFIGKKMTGFGVAISEMICLILFCVFMILFIQFPPLPTNQLACVMIP